jgi:hypothetical protein
MWSAASPESEPSPLVDPGGCASHRDLLRFTFYCGIVQRQDSGFWSHESGFES